MPDFNFVGPAYEAANRYQDAQKLVNWYPEIDQTPGAKNVIALLGCPGMNLILTLFAGQQVRGAWEIPGGTQSLWVAGNKAYLVKAVTLATQTAPATFSATQLGTLATSTGVVVMRDNGKGGYVFLVDGANGYTYNISTQAFAQISDPAFLGADRVAFIDGWLIFNQPGSQVFYTSPLYGVTPFNGTYFALKDGATDNLVTLIEDKRELWLIGERTTEIWFDAGGQNFPFSRLQGAFLQVGCSAKHSLARLGQGIVWLGKSERGQNVVVMTQGYSWQAISNRAVEDAIAQYPVIADAIGFTYEEDGHEFYMLTFPAADVTWCYDLSTGMWHQRLSYDPVNGVFHRHRANCFINFQDLRLIGDYADGTISSLTRAAYSDKGAPLVAWRRTPHVWNDRKRVFHQSLQIEFVPGVGLQTGQGSSPQAVLRWSDDGGQTYGPEHWTAVGAAGQTRNRAIWRRLGYARDRIYDARFSDPVKRDVVGATLLAEFEA